MKNPSILFCLVIALLMAFGAETIFAQKVRLTFLPTSNPSVSTYRIYRSTHVDSSFVLIGTVEHPNNSYTDYDVQVGSRYYYTATSRDASGNESGFSNFVETTITDATTSVAMMTTFSVQVYGRDAVLKWSAVTGNIYGFEIQKGASPASLTTVAFISASGHKSDYSLVVPDLDPGTYSFRIKLIGLNNNHEFSSTVQIVITAPRNLDLKQNYPNPFNPITHISYSLPRASHVKLTIYNTKGQMVGRLIDEFQEAGHHTLKWDGIDSKGMAVSSGTYFYQIKTSESVSLRKMVLTR